MSKSKTNTTGNIDNKIFGGKVSRESYKSESHLSILSKSIDDDKNSFIECVKAHPKTYKEDCQVFEKIYKDSNDTLNKYVSTSKIHEDFQSDVIGDSD